MSRIQLILPLILWAFWRAHDGPPVVDPVLGTCLYFAALLAVIAWLRLAAGRAVRKVEIGRLRTAVRFQQTAFAARWLILGLHAGALFFGGYGPMVDRIVRPWLPAESPGAVLSMLPVILAWAALIWTQYRVDHSVRERTVLSILDAGLPVHVPPTLGQYLLHGVRTQILFTLMPVLLVIVLRDAMVTLAALAGLTDDAKLQWTIALVPVGLVFLIAPELLRRVLPTQRLPDSPLRERLEVICRRLNLRYRDILLWRTNHNVANAAVMGLVPQVRYVMLTDLLIETLDDRQIEAVFAHEAGHVVHRHITWYVVYVVLFFVWVGAAAGTIQRMYEQAFGAFPTPLDAALTAGGIAAFFVLLGFLSRQFERQADLFAARTLSVRPDAASPDQAGVAAFNSALLRVAALNNMPLDAGQIYRGSNRLWRLYARIVHHAATWLHGSVRSRTAYLESTLHRPQRTQRFDRRMFAVRLALLVGALTTTAWLATSIVREMR